MVKMKITKQQLRSLIKEEKARILTEATTMQNIMSQAGVALEMRDGSKLERLLSEVEGLMMDAREKSGYTLALAAMVEAAYELESYENAISEGY